MSYWKHARVWSRANTKTYSLQKAVPAVLAAVAQWWFFSMRPLLQTLAIAGTVIGSYVVLYCFELAWTLFFRAPIALLKQAEEKHTEELERWATRAAETNAALAESNEKLTRKYPQDAYHEALITEWFARISNDQISVFKWLLSNGPATPVKIRNALGLQRQDEIAAAVRDGEARGFVHQTPDPRLSGAAAYYINENYTTAFRNIFYPPPRPAGPLSK